MDSIFVTAALDSTYKVLSTMAQMEPEAGTPVLKDSDQAPGEVTGIMDMVGKQAKGALTLSFTAPVIKAIAERMLGEKLNSIDDTAKDLTGEIVNMVVGGAKGILSEKGYDFDMSTPNVFTGKTPSVKPAYPGQTVTLPFHTDAGDFYLEFTYAD